MGQRLGRYIQVPERRPLGIQKARFPDVVVWNIGEAKSSNIGDLGAGEWRYYACLEAGLVGTPRELAPGETFDGEQFFQEHAAA